MATPTLEIADPPAPVEPLPISPVPDETPDSPPPATEPPLLDLILDGGRLLLGELEAAGQGLELGQIHAALLLSPA